MPYCKKSCNFYSFPPLGVRMNAFSLFISRNLAADSPILALKDQGWQVFCQSLLEFEPLVHPKPQEPFDWVFFSSPKGVTFYPETTLAAKHKYACLGPGTGRAFEKRWHQSPDWIGNGEPDETAKKFGKIALGQVVLFPRARQSRRSIQQRLQDHLLGVDWIIYDNRKAKNFSIPKTDLLVFTSPLNADAYYTRYPDRQNLPTIAIGATTARFLTHAGIAKIIIAESTDEHSLYLATLTWQKNIES